MQLFVFMYMTYNKVDRKQQTHVFDFNSLVRWFLVTWLFFLINEKPRNIN